jgi:Protein of unknown function (DUF3108)
MPFLYRIVFVCCFSLLLPFVGVAQTDFCSSKNISFKEGEYVRYKVFYTLGRIWVHAGEATFNTELEQFNGHSVYHITGDGKTIRSYDWVYKVHDTYETFLDVTTLLPYKFIRNVDEGGFKIYNNISFNQTLGQAVSTKGIYDVPKCIQDVLSAIYFARNIDYNQYKEGDKIPFNMFLDDKVYPLYIRYVGKEKIKTRYGTYNTIKIVPLLIEGTIFKGGEKMMVWVTDDNNHIPVRVNSPILVGSIKVDLFEYKNLKNPLTSLVK